MTAGDVGPVGRLWLVGSGPYHDAAELGMHAFAGSGRSVAAVAGEGHLLLAELLGPQDTCVLVGGDADLAAYARRTAAGAGADVTTLGGASGAGDDPTGAFASAATGVLTLCHRLGAPGVTGDDLDRLDGAIAAARAAPPPVARAALGPKVLVLGSGPAAVTARHLAVVLRSTDPHVAVEGLDAQDVPGSAASHLRPGTVVLALDADRDAEAPVVRVAQMARGEGARVIEVPGPSDLGPVAGQVPLAVAVGQAFRA